MKTALEIFFLIIVYIIMWAFDETSYPKDNTYKEDNENEHEEHSERE